MQLIQEFYDWANLSRLSRNSSSTNIAPVALGGELGLYIPNPEQLLPT